MRQGNAFELLRRAKKIFADLDSISEVSLTLLQMLHNAIQVSHLCREAQLLMLSSSSLLRCIS